MLREKLQNKFREYTYSVNTIQNSQIQYQHCNTYRRWSSIVVQETAKVALQKVHSQYEIHSGDISLNPSVSWTLNSKWMSASVICDLFVFKKEVKLEKGAHLQGPCKQTGLKHCESTHIEHTSNTLH
jgi:hypothetical protein